MPEETQRRYHFGFAQATFESLADNVGDALRESWDPGATIVRYNRRWHLTKIIDETPDYIFARIGFVSEGDLSTLVFDHDRQDFILGDAPSGVVVPFAARKMDGLIVFQLYPGIVRETTFTGALEDLLNADNEMYVWRINSLAEPEDFDSWFKRTNGIRRFDFTLERPNPNYKDRPLIEELVEEAHLEILRLSGRALQGETVDPTSGIFRQALDHVLRNYGKAKLVAEDDDGSDTTWVKGKNSPSLVASKRSMPGFGPEQAPEALLLEAAANGPAGARVVEPMPE